jgi:hypothetical protein
VTSSAQRELQHLAAAAAPDLRLAQADHERAPSLFGLSDD